MHEKKVALITGANKGIGFEIGRQLGKLGFTVVLAARDEAKVNAAADRLRGEGLDVQGVRLDVTDPSTAEAAARWLDERFGRLDVLVNNAGISQEFAGQHEAVGTGPGDLEGDLRDQRLRGLRRHQGDAAPAEEVPIGPDHQPVLDARLARHPQRPRRGVVRRQPAGLQLVEVGPQRPDGGASPRTSPGTGSRSTRPAPAGSRPTWAPTPPHARSSRERPSP